MATNDDIVPGFSEETDDSLRITLERVSDNAATLVLVLNGYVDTYNSNFFQKRVTKAVEGGFKNLIFNCSALSYVSSTGIGSFTSFLKLVKQNGGDIVLLDIQPKVYEVFQLLGFSQFFNIKDSVEDAIAVFKQSTTKSFDLFPKIFCCPICDKKVKASKAGRFKCSGCSTVLAIDEQGTVSLG
ncbi:MAG: STAS domain-containing protein [Treponemataceae bacterium]